MLQTANSTATPSPDRPIWLTEAWLKPRMVVVTLLALIAGALLNTQNPSPLISVLTLIVGVTAFIAGGYFGARGAIETLVHDRHVDIDMLMILAALGAAVIGHWEEGAILLFLFSLSNVLQDYAIGRSRQAIKSLFKLYPEEAHVKRDGQLQTIAVSELRIGDLVLIEPGERIPVDGLVVSGRSSVDQAAITGESIPVDKVVGDLVFAGTLNAQGALDVEVTKLASQSTLSRIITLVEEAQNNQAPTQRFMQVFEQRYAVAIIAATIVLIILPWALGEEFSVSFYRAMTLMTVASPCALAISIPASFIAAIASAARDGVLFKGGASLEALYGIKGIAFDKTGTLTTGKPKVTAVIPVADLDEQTLLRDTAAIESRSEHPLAKAIVRAAQEQSLTLPELTEFDAAPGLGVEGEVEGRRLTVGRLSMISEHSPVPPELSQRVVELEANGSTVVGVLELAPQKRWLGLIALADQLRPEAIEAIKALHKRGIKVAMLTGDNQSVAETIAQQVGIDRVYAELMPEDKVDRIQALQKDWGSVLMVGDGVNDAPALALADLGMAMGGAGSDVALETADIVLMSDDIARLPRAIDLSRKARRVVWQNVTFSILVILVLIAGVFLIDLPLPIGVLGHEGSTVIVVLNGLISLLILPEIARRRSRHPQPA